MADPLNWYFDIPIVSRCYLSGAIIVTTACFLDFVSPLTLYYNYDLIFQKGQYWRLITSYLFFGTFNLDFLFHMYFVVSVPYVIYSEGFTIHNEEFPSSNIDTILSTAGRRIVSRSSR